MTHRLIGFGLGATLFLALGACSGGGTLTNDDPSVKKLVAELGPGFAGADVVKGRAAFEQCRTCHTVVKDGPNMTGPNLNGVFGRAAAARADYAYSDVLKVSGLRWDAATLDKWIANPRGLVPGTKMSFAGLGDANDRRDVIAYLKVATSGGPT